MLQIKRIAFFHTSIAYAVHTSNCWGKIQGKSDQLCLLKDVICNTLAAFLPRYGIIKGEQSFLVWSCCLQICVSEFLLKRVFIVWHSSLTGPSMAMAAPQTNQNHYSCVLEWTCQWKKLVASEVSQSKDDTVVEQPILTISSSFTRDGIRYVKGRVFVIGNDDGSFH